MALRITFDVFSGRPNPAVVVDGLEERELLARLARAKRQGEQSRARTIPQSTLGYRGIVIEQVEDIGGRRAGKGRSAVRAVPRIMRVAGGVVLSGKSSFPATDAFVEDFICGSTGPIRLTGLGPTFSDRVLEELQRYRDMLARIKWRPRPWPMRYSCKCAPLWEPAWWNDAGQVQFNNNCYNYGTNYRSDTYAQPGLAAGAMYASITCADVKAGAVADALIDWPNAKNRCPKEGHLVALVVGPGWDFHWYRKGRNGLWTHKPGGTQATNLDNSSNLITDPRTADRGSYTDFCSFMIVMHGHVKIQ